MIFVLFSVTCSVIVSILLKLARRYEINVAQAIAFNYVAASFLCYVFFKPDVGSINEQAPLGIYGVLGFLLPSIFIVMAYSVKHAGIVRTDIAQRLSLLIPLLAAYLIFGEHFSYLKTGAISLGLIAVLFSIPWDKNEGSANRSWIFPLIVFVGFGIIDVLFKKIATFKTVPFTTSLFLIFSLALSISMLSLLYMVLFRDLRVSLKNLIAGLILGFFNFGNIYFYLKAHQALSTQPSLVFASMNIGVIALGSLVGLWLFKEQLSKLNYLGLLLALIAIVTISLL